MWTIYTSMTTEELIKKCEQQYWESPIISELLLRLTYPENYAESTEYASAIGYSRPSMKHS